MLSDAPPSPSQAHTLDEIVLKLRQLKLWAGNPSYSTIVRRINTARAAEGRPASDLTSKTTVADCFKIGRRRPNEDLMTAIVAALHADPDYAAEWAQALKIALGLAEAATIVSAQNGLPELNGNFVGRRAELDWLRALVADAAGGTTGVVLSIDGMAGIGKTHLAVHAGHWLARERGVDEVQLFVDLRGFHADPNLPPADPIAVLGVFLRLLGVPGSRVPPDAEGRVALYWHRLDQRRAIVVLDNAADAEQVRALIPESPGCVTLITSRRTLTGIPARRLPLTEFAPGDAVDLLRAAAGERRFSAEPDAAAQIAELLGFLPLAVGLVAGLIKESPAWTLTDHLERLVERRKWLRLDDGVELALRLSYEDLLPGLKRMLRLVALHPGNDLDAYGAAALANTELPTAHSQLTGLLTANLLQRTSADRYGLHDLIRVFAINRSQDEDVANARRTALTRVFDHYRHNAAMAMDIIAPQHRFRRPMVPDPGTPGPVFSSRRSAMEWLDIERSNLIAVAVYASDHGWLDHTTDLSAILHRYLSSCAHYYDAEVLHSHASRTTNRAAKGRALSSLGVVYDLLGRYPEALDHQRRAIELFRQVDDHHGEATALCCFGYIYTMLGQYREASAHYGPALVIYREIGDPGGEGRTLCNLGCIALRLGDRWEAMRSFLRSLTLFRQVGSREGEGREYGNIGLVYERLGRFDDALRLHRRSLTIAREIGDYESEVEATNQIGVTLRRMGSSRQATDHHLEALGIARRIGDRKGETKALNALGSTLRCAGRTGHAEEQHREALRWADELGYRHQQADAHDGIARCRFDLGDEDGAARGWRSALALYAAMGTPEAKQVAARLRA